MKTSAKNLRHPTIMTHFLRYTKLLFGSLVLLFCSITVACTSSDAPTTTDTTTTTTTDAPTTTSGSVPETSEPVDDQQPAAPEDTEPVSEVTEPQDSGLEVTEPISSEPMDDRQPADAEAPTGDWVAGINSAGWDFHRHLTGNAVSSPMSIGSAFSLSRAGASADSEAVLDEIFGFPEVGLHGAANVVDLMLSETSVEPTTLEVANRLFPDDEFSPLPDFLNIATTRYGADVQSIDTADGAAGADIINNWVSERTRGLIPKVIGSSAVQDQKLILVNTVYLKADWVKPFLPEYTHDDHFITEDNRSVTVPFMHDRQPVGRRFVQLENADAVELPYKGDELAMWLIVPHDTDGLAAVEESLDSETLTTMHNDAQMGLVDLTMPKWEQTLPPTDLFGWLCPLGFCVGASFDGIAPGIFITTALHGAKVIVDEKGTEAAAATTMAFTESGPPPADLTVVADRPFLWAIVHRESGVLLFVGRLVDPTA